MASTPYLKNNLDSLQTLPVELYQNLTRMRDFNSRTQEVMCNIDKQSDDYLSNAKGYTAHKEGETLSNIKHQFKKEKEYVDDKVKLSIQTYELVDKYIKKLDSEFERFVADIEGRAIRTKINLEENSQQQGLKNIQDQEIKKMSASSEGETAPIKTSKKKHAKKGVTKTTSTVPSKTPLNNIFTKATNPKKSVTSVTVETSSLTGGLIGAGVAHSAEVLDMPVDPNEPTYCLCNQVSYGKMIACDNPDCPIEWFHFKCVKLTTNPKGKWFCPKCITYKKKKKTQYIKN